MGSAGASFQREVNRLCSGNIYREGSVERATALSRLCDTWRVATKAAYPAVREAFDLDIPPAYRDTYYGLAHCAHDAARFASNLAHGRLSLACDAALIVAKQHPAVLATAARFLQRRVP